ncbi:MAG: exodeoxyribonuclease V subunit gamma [Gammaproteobacteria bacterium]|nr:exodeoxyribonuclease V subunit gamma [Gammaproteobacteria bacterium]
MAIEIQAGNRLETLAERLADEIRRNPLDPFEPERIVVPHPTLGRWLVLALAKELGIAANISIELPAQFAWSIMHDALGTLSKDTPFAPDRLRWRIYDQVASLDGPGTAPVRNYLSDGDPRKRFELADRLARVYDRCLLYRPEWIREWERGTTPHWQAQLWRRLMEGTTEPSHWVAAIDAFRAASGSFDEVGIWPRRASIFGVAALSPSYLDLLRQAGEHVDVHLYLLSPCREYWSDIAPGRVIQRRADPVDPALQYRTEGNELLSAWGKLGRDMQALLADAELATGTPEERYDEPDPGTALGAVQRDILDLRLATEARTERGMPTDDSIQIHVCHSAMREAEVLHDRLLGLFDARPDIQPADVLVLTPNIVDYAPAIEAVFAAADVIPFNIARPRASATRAVQAFLDLLALPDSRYGAEAVVAPLESRAVREKFRIAERQLSTLREWVHEAGIRWGIDADHRAAEGLPGFAGHAWRQGIDRLLLGYAMDGETAMFDDVAPYSTDSAGFSGDYELLGRFVDYCESAIELRKLKDDARSAADWAESLHAVVERFFATNWENAGETATVTRLIEDVAAECEVDTPVPFGVLRDVLGRAATGLSRPAARLADGVTVVSLGIGQAFPAKVVCALGMNDRLFPRRPSPSSFDLVDVDDERTGDRNSRDEDRFAFLEALLAARRCFLVSYTGRNVRDDKPMPPSVVVDELRDYLQRRFDGGFDTAHPLQPFSRRYYEAGSNLWSYSASMLDAARTLAGHADKETDTRARERFTVPFDPTVAPQGRPDASLRCASGRLGLVPSRLTSRDAGRGRPQGSPQRDSFDGGEVDLRRLIAFFGNPTRAFLRDRLGVRLEVDEIALAEDEPFELDGLARWALKTEVYEHGGDGDFVEGIKRLVVARGRLPTGGPGEVVYEDVDADVRSFRQALERYGQALKADPKDLELDIGGYRLVGEVENVAAVDDGKRHELLRWRIGTIRPQDRFGAWLELLAWVAQEEVEAEAHLVCLAPGGVDRTVFEAPAPGEAHEHLERWLDAWWRGTGALLPFAPGASMEYAKGFAKSRDHDSAWNAACGQWHGERAFDGLQNPYVALAYDGENPFDEDRFAELAETLLLPLLEAER